MAIVHTTMESDAAIAPRNLKAEAKISGLRGVFLRMVQEHRELTALLLQLKLNADVQLRKELFPILRDELLAHDRAETQVVYAAMSRKEQTRLIAAKHRRTGAEIERLLEQLNGLNYASAAWEHTFALLFNALEQHMIEEESYYFPIAQRVLGESKTHVLRAAYDAARGAIVSRRQ